MKKTIISIVILAFITLSLMLKGPILYERLSSVSQEEFQCSRSLANVTLDNPIERVPISRVEIGRNEAGKITATAYFIGAIEYSRIFIREDCSGASRM